MIHIKRGLEKLPYWQTRPRMFAFQITELVFILFFAFLDLCMIHIKRGLEKLPYWQTRPGMFAFQKSKEEMTTR